MKTTDFVLAVVLVCNIPDLNYVYPLCKSKYSQMITNSIHSKIGY